MVIIIFSSINDISCGLGLLVEVCTYTVACLKVVGKMKMSVSDQRVLI